MARLHHQTVTNSRPICPMATEPSIVFVLWRSLETPPSFVCRAFFTLNETLARVRNPRSSED